MKLIDADVLQTKIDYAIKVAESLKRKTFELKGLKNIIDDTLIAYDIDKVVDELELHSFEFGTDTLPAHYVRLNDAIDIVKRGGLNERI